MRSIRGSLEHLQPLIDVSIAAYDEPFARQTFRALIDTGATRTCITQRVIAGLRLQAKRKMLVASATSTPERRMAYSYSLGLFCRNDLSEELSLYVVQHEFVAPWFQDNASFDVLLGMDVLSQGTLLFEPDQTFTFTFNF